MGMRLTFASTFTSTFPCLFTPTECRVCSGSQNLSVAATLPPGYLGHSVQPTSPGGKGVRTAKIKFTSQYCTLNLQGREDTSLNHGQLCSKHAAVLWCTVADTALATLVLQVVSYPDPPPKSVEGIWGTRLFCKQKFISLKRTTIMLVHYLPPDLQPTGPDIKWVDGHKPLFRVTTKLDSTIYTEVPGVH